MKKVLFLLPFIIMMFGNATAQGQVSQKDFDAVVASWGQVVQPDATALQDFRKGLTSSGIPQTLAMGRYMVLDTLYFGSVKFTNGKSASDTNMVVLSADLDMLKAGNTQLKGKKIPFMAITEKSNKSHLIVYFDSKKPAPKQTAPTSAPALAQNSGGAQNTSTTPTTAQKAPQGTGQVGTNPVAQNQVVLAPGDIVMIGGIEHIVAKDGSFMLTANGQAQRDALYKAPPPAPVAVAPIDTTLQTATYAMSVSTTGNPKLLSQPAPGAATAQTTPASTATNLPSGPPSQIRNSDGSIGILQLDGTYKTFVDPTTVSANTATSGGTALDPNDPKNAVAIVATAEGDKTFYNKNSPWVQREEVEAMTFKRNQKPVTRNGQGQVEYGQERATTHLGIRHGTDNELNPTEATVVKFENQGLRRGGGGVVAVTPIRRARVTHHGSGGYAVGDPNIVWP